MLPKRHHSIKKNNLGVPPFRGKFTSTYLSTTRRGSLFNFFLIYLALRLNWLRFFLNKTRSTFSATLDSRSLGNPPKGANSNEREKFPFKTAQKYYVNSDS